MFELGDSYFTRANKSLKTFSEARDWTPDGKSDISRGRLECHMTRGFVFMCSTGDWALQNHHGRDPEFP